MVAKHVFSRIRHLSAKLMLDRWQLLFLLFIIACGLLLLFNLAYSNVIWDETPHLYGGLLLSQGQLQEYLGVSIYPPLLDVVIAAFFRVFGASVFAGRLVSVTFCLLTLWVLFKLAYRMYGRRVAFLSCIILATMPGVIWLSRETLLEMALEFFFLAALFLFVNWLQTGKDKILLFSGLVLGLAFLTKYQALVAGLVMVISLPFLFYRSKFKAKVSRFPILVLAASTIVAPDLFATYVSGTFGQWLSMLQLSDPMTNLYGARFSLPIFYFIEMTYPLVYAHPISILVFILGLHGLGLFLWRRKPEDKLFLVWFVVVYVFFTFVGTKSWRYVLPLFPVLAISAASFVSFLYDLAEKNWKSKHLSLDTKWMVKFLAACLIVFTAGAIVYSTIDAYVWVSIDAVSAPFPEAIHYLANDLNSSESVMVVCPVNEINSDMIKFYLDAYESKNSQVWEYPVQPVDAYTPNFNVSEMVTLCQENNTKYLILYEDQEMHYFNSSLTPLAVYNILAVNGNFTYQTTFGTAPNRIFIFQLSATLV